MAEIKMNDMDYKKIILGALFYHYFLHLYYSLLVAAPSSFFMYGLSPDHNYIILDTIAEW